MLVTEVARLFRRSSILSSLSRLDSLDRTRSTFSAKPSDILKALGLSSSEQEPSFCFFSLGEQTESPEDEPLDFRLMVDTNLSIRRMC